MKRILSFTLIFCLLIACNKIEPQNKKSKAKAIEFTQKQATSLSALPLKCLTQEYPNKLSQTLANAEEMGTPSELHPAFYGCYDWHSAVHGHWSLVMLLKNFPNLANAEEMKAVLKQNLTPQNIAAELLYFQRESEKSYERTYGWAWYLKLQQELDTWDTELGKELSQNLKPLTHHLIAKYMEYLPKLNYPIRVGEHSNTAFGLSFAYDYALHSNDAAFKTLIEKRAKDFYSTDQNCPLSWEPSGYDFLSPCMQEVDIMRKVLQKEEFIEWSNQFLPSLSDPNFSWEVAKVSDRKDGKLVHLDGLNFSRAWTFYALANQYPDTYGHLTELANTHFMHSFPNLVNDHYEGGHWLGSFALYALQTAHENKK